MHAACYPAAMADPGRRPARNEDLAALPANVVGEILADELVASPRPSPQHAAAAMGVSATLGPPFHFGDGGPGGWWILPEPEVHLGENVVVPDLAGWRRARVPTLPDSPYLALAPDWVCEILSPSTTRLVRVRKMPVYAAHGVHHLWHIDPTARTLEVYRNDGEHWVLLGTHDSDDEVRAEPFEGLALRLARWWGEPG